MSSKNEKTADINAANAENKASEKQLPLWKRIWLEVREFVAIIVGFFLLFTFILVNARIPSGSMENTIMTGDRVFGNRLAYIKEDPERFDIVIFKYPDDPSRLFVKRVIGLPGETVEIRGGKVYIDGSTEPLVDSFCPEQPLPYGDGIYVVPEGHYFLMGDNRNHSNDSRFWDNKYASRDAIIAKAGFRYWPLTKIGPVKSTIDSEKCW